MGTAGQTFSRRLYASAVVACVVALGAAALDIACSHDDPPPLAAFGDTDATVDAPAGDDSVDVDAIAASEDASDAGVDDASEDAPIDCSAAHQTLAALFDGSTCGVCVESKCTDFYNKCTQSCSCTTGLDVLFQCLELGGTGSDCQDRSFPYLPSDDYAPAIQCKVACLYSCGILEAGPDE